MEFKQRSVQTPSMFSSRKQASIIFPRDQHAWLQLKYHHHHPGCPTNVHAAIWVWQPGGMIHVHSSKCYIHLLRYWLPMVAGCCRTSIARSNFRIRSFFCSSASLRPTGEMDPWGMRKMYAFHTSYLSTVVGSAVQIRSNLEVHGGSKYTAFWYFIYQL